jgi:hypothetical protein
VDDGALDRMPVMGRRKNVRAQRRADVVSVTAEKVLVLADAIPDRYRIGVLGRRQWNGVRDRRNTTSRSRSR